MNQIKTRERVKNLAEVYTNDREVNAMLNLIPIANPQVQLNYRYLEPSCGNGNFLIEILDRKICAVHELHKFNSMSIYLFYLARAVSTIYGIDICSSNVQEAIKRLKDIIVHHIDTHFGINNYSIKFLSIVDYILENNIVCGDALNQQEIIVFIEFVVDGFMFERRFYTFKSLIEGDRKPNKKIKKMHFLKIGTNDEEEY